MNCVSYYKTYHLAWNLLLHYLANYEGSTVQRLTLIKFNICTDSKFYTQGSGNDDYLTTPVWPSDAFQSITLMLHWLWRSQNLSVQSIEPLMMRVSSNCRHVTASWWPWSVLIQSPLNVHTCHAHWHKAYRHITLYTMHCSPLNNQFTSITTNLTTNPVVYSVPLASPSCMFSGQKPTLDVMLSPLLLPKPGTIYLPQTQTLDVVLSPLLLPKPGTISKPTTLHRHNTLTT